MIVNSPHSRSKSALGAFVSAAGERQSLTLALVGIGVSLATFFVAKSEMIPLWLMVFSTIFLCAVIYILIAALKDLVSRPIDALPALRAVIRSEDNDNALILLLEPSNLFGMYSRVSVYHLSDESGYELLIGYGSVLTVQGDGKIQIKIEQWMSQDKRILDGIANQTSSILRNTIVKPSAPAYDRERLGLGKSEIDSLFARLIVSAAAASDVEVES